MAVPVFNGYSWPSKNVTYSFIPDGFLVNGYPNVLNALYNAAYPEATWKGEIRRALGTWQANSGLVFSKVPDDGSPPVQDQGQGWQETCALRASAPFM